MPRTYPKRIPRSCKHCGAEFSVQPHRIGKGRGNYCSQSCAASGWQRPPLIERFWKRVFKTDTCWLWTGAKSHGYGIITVNGRQTKATHISWQLAGNTNPDGLCLLHNCPGGDNRSCVNPDHLWLGTRDDNNKDSGKKGRKTPNGEQNTKAVLTTKKVLEIRARYAVGGISYRTLAKEYNISPCTVRDVVVRRTWHHI